MQELNASSVVIRLMNHAKLLEASEWGCRQEAVNKGQTDPEADLRTVRITPD